jgi:UDP-glucose-4-epimerase GalE
MAIRSGHTVLVTGGAGYIGAHTAKALREAGHHPVVFDNLSSGFRAAVRWGEFIHGDIRDTEAVAEALRRTGARRIIHFAGLIEVGRSVVRPDLFWRHNVAGFASVLRAAAAADVTRVVFSSSAAVYGQQPDGAGLALLQEDAPKAPASPYGDTKLAGEWMLAAHAAAFGYSAVALRYFNAAGADSSGLIGEAHQPETHLIPLAVAAALGQGKPLTVFGADFPTPDGSCLRDYVHVDDLAAAHVAALELALPTGAFEAFNVGAGRGASVFEVLAAIEAACGRAAPFVVGARRAGDPASLVADPTRAAKALGWTPRCSDLDHIIRTALAWHAAPRYGAPAPEPGIAPVSEPGGPTRAAPASSAPTNPIPLRRPAGAFTVASKGLS